MSIIFLVTPLRRPYELYYFSAISDSVIIATDRETFESYTDWFEEFKTFGFRYVFLPLQKRKGLLSFESTASMLHFDENALLRVIEKEKISTIVTVELFSILSFQASRIASKLSLKHIVIVWENIRHNPLYYFPPFSGFTRTVKTNAHKFIAVSDLSKRSIIPLGIKGDRVDVIHPGIFVERFEQMQSGSNSILFVGNLDPHKGVHILLSAFEEIAKSYDWSLTLVGKGSLEPRIARLRDRGLNIERVDYVPHSRITSVYSNAGIFCSPSIKIKKYGIIPIRQEQFGFTLVEAMASELPVVSTTVGAIPEILGSNNILVRPREDQLVEAISSLISDESLCRRIGQNNRQQAFERFNALTQSKKFREALDHS